VLCFTSLHVFTLFSPTSHIPSSHPLAQWSMLLQARRSSSSLLHIDNDAEALSVVIARLHFNSAVFHEWLFTRSLLTLCLCYGCTTHPYRLICKLGSNMQSFQTAAKKCLIVLCRIGVASNAAMLLKPRLLPRPKLLLKSKPLVK
jgi:hypothetical protein